MTEIERTAAEDLPSAALIAAGKCPGWTWGRRYGVDPDSRGYVSKVNECGKPITRGDLCGIHDNRRRRQQDEAEKNAAARAAIAERQRRVSLANNVAMMLSDAIRRQYGESIHFEATADGSVAFLDVEGARALLEWLS